jgi:hypothetical protein
MRLLEGDNMESLGISESRSESQYRTCEDLTLGA